MSHLQISACVAMLCRYSYTMYMNSSHDAYLVEEESDEEHAER